MYILAFLDGYGSTVQGLLDWFEVDLGSTKRLLIQTDFERTFTHVRVRMYDAFHAHFCESECFKLDICAANMYTTMGWLRLAGSLKL